MKLDCPYCGKEAEKVKGDAIYPHRKDLYHKKFFLCVPCDAYVGCHDGKGFKALGRLADRELRKWKQMAHTAFDPLWRRGKMTSRDAAYYWLADQMGISKREAHIGKFNVDQCKQVIELVGRDFGAKNEHSSLPTDRGGGPPF